MSRPAAVPVNGYDLTFTPVKSVSALWALAPPELAAVVERAHAGAVADTLDWLERQTAYTRLGRDGIRQVEVRGLLAVTFTHRDSRAGDPNLHNHVAVSNQVQTLDGRWRALDGRPLHALATAASERYNTRLEALLVDRLGVTFAERLGSTPGKRAVREVVGFDGRLLELWSSRRAAIEVRSGQLTAGFQSEHGRPPSPVEATGSRSRPPWRPGRPSTSPARSTNSARAGGPTPSMPSAALGRSTQCSMRWPAPSWVRIRQ